MILDDAALERLEASVRRADALGDIGIDTTMPTINRAEGLALLTEVRAGRALRAAVLAANVSHYEWLQESGKEAEALANLGDEVDRLAAALNSMAVTYDAATSPEVDRG